MLKLVNIKKDYRVAETRVRALRGVNLEFRRNEFVCILGQSGCGKTTLLNIVGGLDQYTSGDLIIQGKSTKAFQDRDWDVYRNHKIGFIFQSYNLIPHQTVLGNVELALTIAGIGKEERRERAKKALIRVGLGEQLNKRPNQLSGGQMQRVAIARALVNNPAILLADEPTGALDSETSVQIMNLIREIAGERLVIMVTHNPELAEQYASRIVKLQDGRVISDTNPYDSAAEAQKRRAMGVKPPVRKKRPVQKKRKARTSMSFWTSLALSARNLLTKKGRTFITSVAGSIGIISVCLVLALSNGFNNYIKKTQEDMLSYYPVTITERSLDVSSIMAGMASRDDMPDLSQLGDKIYVNSFLTKIAKGMTVTNNLSPEYISYIEGMDKSYYNAIQYSYGEELTENLFTEVTVGDTAAVATTKNMSLASLKEFYRQELTMKSSEYGQLAYLVDYLGSVVNTMPDTLNVTEEGQNYVKSQYDVIAGDFPKAENEAVLVVGENNDITDLTLAQLGFIDEVTFLSLFDLGGEEKKESLEIAYDSIVGKPFTLFFNDSVYTKNPEYTGNPLSGQYAFTYSGEKDKLTAEEGEGLNVTVSGILRLKDGYTYGCLSDGLNLTEGLIQSYLTSNKQSEIVQWMNDDANRLSYPMGDGTVISLHQSPSERLNRNFYKAEIPVTIPGMGSMSVTLYVGTDSDAAIRSVGGSTAPNAIAFYAKDFETKASMLAYLDAWNDSHEEGELVTYSDTVGVMLSLVETMLNAVTYVLVAFTAISLVVSSVMIGIITYVSVVERVKEIGVLRSLGARKKDIRNLFNAETFIIGLSAGVIGVAVTYILSFIVNAILGALTGIANLAALPFTSAFVMVVVSVVLTLISGLIPASAAARKDPVIALRTE